MLIVMANLSFGQPLVAPNNGNQTSLTAIRAISVEPVKTYEFYLDNSPDSDPYYTQCVKDGGILLEPTVPNKEGQVFSGWYIGENLLTFDNTPIEVTTTDTIRVEAYFYGRYYVKFMDENGNELLATKEVDPGGTTNDDEVPFIVNEYGVTFKHWSETLNGDTPFDFSAPINKDVTLYAVTQQAWRVQTNSQGGTPRPMQIVLNNEFAQ